MTIERYVTDAQISLKGDARRQTTLDMYLCPEEMRWSVMYFLFVAHDSLYLIILNAMQPLGNVSRIGFKIASGSR